MIDGTKFTGGMLKLAAAVRQTLTDADFEAYDSLRKHASTDEWVRYVAWCLDTGEHAERWPLLADLRESLVRWCVERKPKLPGQIGKCEECDGTGFERYLRDGYSWARPCPACRPATVAP